MNVMKDYMYADQATRYQVVKNHFERAVHDAKVRQEKMKRGGSGREERRGKGGKRGEGAYVREGEERRGGQKRGWEEGRSGLCLLCCVFLSNKLQFIA
jgi:hypothetical protein